MIKTQKPDRNKLHHARKLLVSQVAQLSAKICVILTDSMRQLLLNMPKSICLGI